MCNCSITKAYYRIVRKMYPTQLGNTTLKALFWLLTYLGTGKNTFIKHYNIFIHFQMKTDD